MNKDELLRELSLKVQTGELNRQEILRHLNFITGIPETSEAPAEKSKSFSMTKMLYVLGAAIVVIGIVIFAAQIWEDIGAFGRIAITLGLGFIMTVTGSALLKSKPDDNIGLVFQAIGGLLIPGGAMVTLYEMDLNLASLWSTTFTFGVIFIFYILLNLAHKNAVLTFFAIANGTAFIYLLIESMIDGSFYMHGDLYAYLTMVVGASYMLLAHSFRGGWNQKLVGVLYFFGSTGFLGAAFSQVFDAPLWQMFYFLLVIGGLFLSAYMNSRAILVMSTIFLIAHVSYITSEYFADSLGWPISLVILGFVFIGLGYVSININKKYIAK